MTAVFDTSSLSDDVFANLSKGAEEIKVIDYSNSFVRDHIKHAELMTMVWHDSVSTNVGSADNKLAVKTLVPCTTVDRRFFVSRSKDVLRGIYIPEHIDWIELSFYTVRIEVRLRHKRPKTLDELRDEVNRIPVVKDLEILLEEARSHEQLYVHTGKNKISFNGIVYKRWLFIEPFIPLAALAYEELNLEFSEDTTFYCEMETLSGPIRSKMGIQDGILYSRYLYSYSWDNSRSQCRCGPHKPCSCEQIRDCGALIVRNKQLWYKYRDSCSIQPSDGGIPSPSSRLPPIALIRDTAKFPTPKVDFLTPHLLSTPDKMLGRTSLSMPKVGKSSF